MKRLFLLFFGFFIHSGCAISRPMSGPGYDSSMQSLTGDSNRDVYIAITNAYVDRSKRSLFDRKTQEIYKSLDKYEGYLMGSVRLKILGKEVWTYSVWSSREALDKFANSRQHVDAMYNADTAILQMRSLVLKIKARDIPISWEKLEEIIEREKMHDYEPL